MNKLYIFNHAYYLRHEKDKTYLLSRNCYDNNVDINIDWRSIIHPVYAMILSFFSKPILLEDAIYQISQFLDIDKRKANELIKNFIENKTEFHTHYKGYNNNFPKNLIISAGSETSNVLHTYKVSDFIYKELDFTFKRPQTSPLGLNYMVNNRCLTDCIYCYADKKQSKILPFERVKSIIEEANEYSIQSFGIIGGEFFLYPHWRKLLAELKRYNYKPTIISTKVPLKEDDIKDFIPYNIPLQISLDSIKQETLNQIVGKIPNYAEKMLSSIETVSKYGKFQIATVLTKFNDSLDELKRIHDFLLKIDNLSRWEVRVGFKSLYSKANFNEIKTTDEKIKLIEEWIHTQKEKSDMNILWSPGQKSKFFRAKDGSQSFEGARCSANYTHMVILPDGKVTICEQLYWKPQFIIGDITKQSISEIWTSEKALMLANLTERDYSSESLCKHCSIRSACDSHQNKCYTNIIKMYGDSHWDFPDPRCIYAPKKSYADELYF